MSTTLVPAHDVSQLSSRRTTIIRLVALAGIIGGIVLALVGVSAWALVSTQLAAEKITVAEDSPFLAGATVDGPFTAWAEADIIQHHSLEASGGATYAQLDRDDPTRATVMNGSFLRTSLFTSVVSFGISAFAIVTGLLFGLFGWVVRSIVPAHRPHAHTAA